MHVDLYVSSFCGACTAAKAVVAEAGRMLPALSVAERNVAAVPELAEAERIRSTPTVIVRDAGGAEVFRAAGAPTLPQLLGALALAV